MNIENLELYYKWYEQPVIKFQLIKFLKNREFVLLSNNKPECSTRMLRCHNVQHLDVILRDILKIKTKEIIYNFYYSLALYKEGIPYQTPNLSERDNSEWVKTHFREMKGYDFLLDIDAGNHDEINTAYESALMIKDLFDSLNVPYGLRFSGCGFHFIIPYFYFYEYSFNPKDDDSIYKLYIKIADKLFKKYSELIDKSIYDSRRVCKVPYSLSVYDNEMYMCFPFSSNFEFNNFKLNNMKAVNQFPIINLYRKKDVHVFNVAGNVNNLLKKLHIKYKEDYLI